MGNSQLQPAHFNKRAHHKKRGGAPGVEGDAVAVEQAQAEQVAEQPAPAEQAPTNDKNCPCPCPSGEPAAEKPSVAQQAENKVKEGQAALIGAVTGTAANAKAAAVGNLQGLVGKMNAFVGNDKPEAAPAAGGGRRTRKQKRKHKKTKRTRKHKKAKRSRKPKRK